MAPSPPLSRSLSKRDACALLLVAAGIAGMIRHFSAAESVATADLPKKQVAVLVSPRVTSPARAAGGAVAREDALKDMRRLLRDFIIPFPGIKNLPVSDALAILQNHWQTLPHAVDPAPRAGFVLNDAATRLLASGGPPVLVSLEIPGISLLTNLRLLAAQAGMKVTFADSGAILIPTETRESEAVKTAEWPLSSAVLETFSHASRRLRARHDPDSGEALLTHSWILQPVFATRTLPGAGLIREEMSNVEIGPEEIEWDEFVNYGTQVVQSEEIVITDSSITANEIPGDANAERLSEAWPVREDETLGLGRPFRWGGNSPAAYSRLELLFKTMGVAKKPEPPVSLATPFLDPSDARGQTVLRLVRMGLGYWDLGQFEEARDQFAGAKSLSPDNPLFLEQLARFERLVTEDLIYYTSLEGDNGGKQRSTSQPMVSGHEEEWTPTGYAWSREAGMLSATGDSRTLRVAAEVAAAIQEAAELGAKLEILAADWGDKGTPPFEPPRNLSRRTNPPSTRVGVARLLCGAHDSVEFPAPPSRAYDLATRLNDRLQVEIEAVGSRFQINAGVGCAARPDYLSGASNARISGNAHKFKPVTISPDHWVRLDIPSPSHASAEARAGRIPAARRESLFLRVSRATIPPK